MSAALFGAPNEYDMKAVVRRDYPLLYQEIISRIEAGTFDPNAPVRPELRKVVEELIGSVDDYSTITGCFARAEQELQHIMNN